MIGSSVAAVLVNMTVITALALLATRLARRARAAVRHVVLAAAFVGLLCLPLASAMATWVSVSVPMAAPPELSLMFAEPVQERAAGVLPDATAGDSDRTSGVATARAVAWPPSSLVAATWAVGSAVVLLPLVIGAFQMRRLRRCGLAWPAGRSFAETRAREAGIRRAVDVRLHDSGAGPLTFGLWRPIIVLPEDARRWPAEDLDRALVHELEHVRRRDWPLQCLARVVCAAYWFHPLVWIARRQLELEAERACDDAVLNRGDATAYADQLVLLAERLNSAHRPLLAMANRSDLSTRVTALLDRRQARGRAGLGAVATAFAAAAIVTIATSPLRIVAATGPGADLSQSERLRFDVASIKPCQPGADAGDGATSRPRGSAGGTNASISPGRFSVPCVTLEQLIYLAYASYGASESELLANDYLGTASDETKVRGGPAWIHSRRDRFAIEAKALEPVTDRRILMGRMLRALLEDRFKLRIHRETENAPMFALRVARGGLKLQPMKEGDCEPGDGSAPAAGQEKKPCGFMQTSRHGQNSTWFFNGFRLGFLARQLASVVGRHVIDETGVTGEFSIRLLYADDSAAADALDAGPSIVTAIEQQLGLTLVKTTGPRGYLVVDHAERPAPDAPASGGEAPAQDVRRPR
jgi:uncharacterized protein (TIGR03435 family)